MSKNHLLLASKIGELPHHYFTVEHAKLVEEFNKHINNGKIVNAINPSPRFKQKSVSPPRKERSSIV